MAWVAKTATEAINGNSSMGTNTSLNRPVVAIPSGQTITGYEFNLQLSAGAGSGTYGSFPTGSFAQFPFWFAGLAYVVTGGTVPNIITDADDAQMLWAVSMDPYFSRNTINTAGSPAYQDQNIWGLLRKGRLQLNSGAGGSIYMVIGNGSSVTVLTEWECVIRATYDTAV